MTSRSFAAAVAVLIVGTACPGEAGTWRVGRAQNDCSPPCHWYDGHPQVSDPGFAIRAAMLSPSVLPGDTVKVWPGSYPAKVSMKSGVVLISNSGPATTTFLGSAGLEPGLFILAADPATAVIGFTFRWDASIAGNGGGIGAYVSSGTIRDNVFRQGRAGSGSGIYLQTSNMVVENNLFVSNTCAAGGGTVAVSGGSPTIRNNTFTANSAPFGLEGASIYSVGSDLLIERNIVHGSIGASAVFCGTGNHPTVSCNLFWNNPLGAFGGQCVDSVGTSGNIAADPLFCNAGAGNYGLCTDSPALTGPCGAIGYASPGGNCAACGATSVSVVLEAVSWGRLKALYR